MSTAQTTTKTFTFDHAELDLTDLELSAINAICDHLETLKPGCGVEVKLKGEEKLLFLAPVKSNTSRLSNIRIIPVDFDYEKIQLHDSDELLVALQEFDSLKEIVYIAKTISLCNARPIVHWDRFMADLRNEYDECAFDTVEQLLEIIRAANNLDELKIQLGVSEPVILHGEKYSSSTFREKLINRIVYHQCGICFLETDEGSFKFRIDEPRPIEDTTGDRVLLELQFERGINLQ
jgi:hypothetical protein